MGIDTFGLLGGVDRGVYVRHNPWHINALTDQKLVVDAMSIAEAVEWAFPWQVQEVKLSDTLDFADFPGGDEFKALIRTDTRRILSVNSNTYGVLQPDVLRDLGEAVQMVDNSFGTGANKLNVFSLHHGKVIVLYIQRDEPSTLGGGDVVVERGLTIINSYDKSYALSAKPVSWVTECMNTMPSARAFSVATLKHTKNVESYLPAMRSALAETYNTWQQMDAEIEALLSAPYTRVEYMRELVPALIGDRPDETGRSQTAYDTKFDSMIGQWGAAGQQAAIGSKWGALMAVNSFELWAGDIRKGDRQSKQIGSFLSNDFPLTKKAQKVLADA
jgi:hypothetical protein